MVQDSTVETQLIRWCSILLLRQHVSALELGHHHASNCASEETIQCSIHNEISLIAWPLKNIDYNNRFSWHLSMVTLPTRSRCEHYTVWFPLRHNSRPDDYPVQGPKHVVLVIKYYTTLICGNKMPTRCNRVVNIFVCLFVGESCMLLCKELALCTIVLGLVRVAS